MYPVKLGPVTRFLICFSAGRAQGKRIIAFVQHAQFPVLYRAFSRLLFGNVRGFLSALPPTTLYQIKCALMQDVPVKAILHGIDPNALVYKDSSVWTETKEK